MKDPKKEDEKRKNETRGGGDALLREQVEDCCCATENHLEWKRMIQIAIQIGQSVRGGVPIISRGQSVAGESWRVNMREEKVNSKKQEI